MSSGQVRVGATCERAASGTKSSSESSERHATMGISSAPIIAGLESREMATPNWLVAVALLAPLAAWAQQAEREERMSSSVGLRRDSRLEAVDLAELRRRLLAEVDWKLTLGVAEVRAENGERVTATPFQVRARFNEGRTAFKLSGEGYAWLRSDEGSASGYRDVNAMLTQVVASGTVLEGGMTLP